MQENGRTSETVTIPEATQKYEPTPEELEAIVASESEEDDNGIDSQAEELDSDELEQEEILNMIEDEDNDNYYDVGFLEGKRKVFLLHM